MRKLLVLVLSLTASAAGAQAPAPGGLVVGSGNFFSPIASDLDRAVAFYRDGLGLEVTGTPANAEQNLPLRNMFGLPDASLRWTIARPPAMRTGVEIVEITQAGGRAAERRIQDGGAVTLVVDVRDVDAALAKMKAIGAPVVTTGWAPVAVPSGASRTRAVVVKDPDGHFVSLVQSDPPPATSAPDTANVVGVRVRLTVEDAAAAMRLYCDQLGLLSRQPVGTFAQDPGVMAELGLAAGRWRMGAAEVPTSGLVLEFVEFEGVDHATVRANIQDPGSTRMQVQVRDIDAAIDVLEAAGGAVVSTGGGTVELGGRGGATTKVAIVRDPNNLFLVLLQVAQ